ncbi:MAG: DUF3822 family protein [Bacteroidales bacterium]
MNNRISYKTDNFLELGQDLKRASICISADGCSFTACKPGTKEILAFLHEPIFMHNQGLLEYKIENILISNKWLTELEYNRIDVIIDSKLLAFVPEISFSETMLDKYLVPTSSSDSKLRYSKIKESSLYAVFEDFTWTDGLLAQYFNCKDIRHSHNMSLLTDRTETTKRKTVVSCHLSANHLYVCAMNRNTELLNYISVDIVSKEDVLYYLLKVIRSLPTPPNEISLNFSGLLNSSFIRFMKRNLKDVEIVVCENEVPWAVNDKNGCWTEYYDLLKLCQCES